MSRETGGGASCLGAIISCDELDMLRGSRGCVGTGEISILFDLVIVGC